MTAISRVVQSPPPPDLSQGELLVQLQPGRCTILHVGLKESDGSASAALAARLRPELDTLAQAVERSGVQ